MSNEADTRCCALVDDHESCCAYWCSACSGLGRLDCYPDDLGCDCGICDGDGYCPDCSGQGWFNEFGDNIPKPRMDEIACGASCDWGDCDAPGHGWRWSVLLNEWLPACREHHVAHVWPEER